MSDLKQNLETSVNAIVNFFAEKQGLYFDFFVGDDINGVACFSNEYYINISDVCFDVFSNQPKRLITQWQEEYLENKNKTINYQSYAKGLRFHMVEEVKCDCLHMVGKVD